MARIRIAKVPDGIAPVEVRQKWVGLEFDAEGPVQRSYSPIGKPWEVKEGMVYRVKTPHALRTLIDLDFMAAAWYCQVPTHIGPYIYFMADDCVEIAVESVVSS